MRVLMLGWEFPPYISGGLGTACYGLTKALSRRQMQVTFVLPRAVNTAHDSHVKLLPAGTAGQSGWSWSSEISSPAEEAQLAISDPALANVTFLAVPSRIRNPYAYSGQAASVASQGSTATGPSLRAFEPISVLRPMDGGNGMGGEYQGDLMAEAQRYARLCVDLARHEDFDVIHAHDWLTFPAGMAVAAATGKPLVVHVHSTEFDRAGQNIHQQIYDIERRGMQAAVRVIAVSHLTRSVLERRYGVDPDKIDVVYNGIDYNWSTPLPNPTASAIHPGDKIVLFLGRITMQKGPEYFVAAAKKVLEKFDRVKFVIAGAGDRTPDVIELAAREGLGAKVIFTGFLRGQDVQRVFRMADVYVMPSVSEPFGIAALEAIRHEVPVIVSKTSGVSEVLQHVLKVDFWDVDEMANKIIAVLRHPPLASTLRHNADIEVRRLTWDDAAAQCQRVYRDALAVMPR